MASISAQQGAASVGGQEVELAVRQAVQQAMQERQVPAQVVRDYAQAVRDAAAADAPIPPAPPGVRVISVGDQHIIMGSGVTEVVEVPGGGAATTEVPPIPPFPQPEVPEEVVIMSVAFFIMIAVVAIGWPIARAFARRMDRQQHAPSQQVVTESAAAIRRIEQAVDTLALEMERVSENQRFVTKLLAERQLAPAELPDGRGR